METGREDWAGRSLGELATQRQLSGHTIAAYRRDLAELRTLAGHDDWALLNHADMRRFAARLHAGGQEPRSIARKLSGWRGFYGWLSRQIALPANPVEGVRAPYCGPNKDFEAVRWLENAEKVRSTVLLPLTDNGTTFGLLVLGSPDTERFSPAMATDFLVQLGQSASAALAPLRA